MDLFNYINTIYNHSFLFIRKIKMNEEFLCSKCNTFYYIYSFGTHLNKGIYFENRYYAIYKSADIGDLDLILFDNILNCEEQIIKNLLE